ncbi:MAG: hypothetical protein ABIU05_27440 [Nitrospirales bacterium]
MNKQGLAKAFKVSPNTVTDWVRKGCPCTVKSDGSYVFDLAAVRQWREKTRKVCTPVSATLAAAQLRKESALADLREMEVRKKRGELIERVTVEQDAFRVGRTMRDALLGLPDRLSGVLASENDQRKVHALLTKEIRQCLEALHDTYSKQMEPPCR